PLIALFASLLVVVAGCRNDIVGPPPRTDAGFEGEGEGEGNEGEGEGEGCDDDVPAVSLRIASGDGFVYCAAAGVDVSVTLTPEGGAPEAATEVPAASNECRYQGGFGVPGRYAVDIVVEGFAPQSLSLNAPTSSDGCNTPITASASVTLVAN
ncbi:MAG TPA: hypothetical protein VGF99_17770, partial [Myxococcota bacterium]